MISSDETNQAVLNFTTDRDGYPAGFWKWLESNEPVYRAFCSHAFRMAMRNRKRYSAKTIVELIRWNTDLSDSEKTFKINNSYTSGMARLFMAEYGDRYPGFFSLRDSRGNDV